MNKPKFLVLQLCPYSAYLESHLGEQFEVVKWFELDELQQSAWLATYRQEVRGIATGGHLGCPNQLIEELPQLGIISINGVGFDKVDLSVASERGIVVTNTPDVLTEDVADLAVGLVISLLREIPAAHAYTQAGRWAQGDVPLARKVTGKRFGIVGMGRIGSAIADRLAPFGPICYTDLQAKPVPYTFHANLASLAEACDVLILASSANTSTFHLIDSHILRSLGPSGYLVNVARGSLVDERALAEALEEGYVAGAALDVFEAEPNVPPVLRESPKVVLTPHIASATVETRTRMADLVLGNLIAFSRGEPAITPVR
jgi:lactate dehydrogenase-like 2-hydroxyacid dehydrogenase